MVETERPTPPTADVRAMSEAERDEVRRLHEQGLGVREIARRYGRAPSTISRILREGGGARAARPGKARRGRPSTAAQTRATGDVSRQELRSLEQRVAKIETLLSRMATLITPGRAGKR